MDKTRETRKRVFNFELPAETHARLKRMAAARERSASAEARLAIEDRLAEFEAQSEKAAA